jgi:hypothetical protein
LPSADALEKRKGETCGQDSDAVTTPFRKRVELAPELERRTAESELRPRGIFPSSCNFKK